ncbi:LamG-like jellyroll fold domain-containing protein [Streptomyces sp. NPDC053048]|uniref:LamG-like jellyroll fold domain-containing protein n=1 Tax=Streptomyces sp. NPDC053048 TaxID=3365694 RepID=UPI0037D55CE1
MADLWELILHHTYAGTPGSAFDLSPGRGGHGTSVGHVDYFDDGATAGSGAISVQDENSAIEVQCGKNWDTLDAVRGEVRFRQDPSPDPSYFQTLVACQWFEVMTYGLTYDEVSARNLWVRFLGHTPQKVVLLQGLVIPYGKWITVGFMYDGRSRIEMSVDGHIVRSATGAYAPVPGGPSTVITIGNSLDNVGVTGFLLSGQIDEVKLWRRNPHRMGDEFLGRPMDADTADCWARWGRAVGEWLRRNPDCAEQLKALLDLLDETLRTVGSISDPQVRARIENAVVQYRGLWSAGQVNNPAMTGVLLEIVDALRTAGVDVEPALGRITGSDCWKRLLKEVPEPGCDRDLVAVLGATAQQVAAARKNLRRPTTG